MTRWKNKREVFLYMGAPKIVRNLKAIILPSDCDEVMTLV